MKLTYRKMPHLLDIVKGSLNILRISVYYAHSMHFCSFKFLGNRDLADQDEQDERDRHFQRSRESRTVINKRRAHDAIMC